MEVSPTTVFLPVATITPPPTAPITLMPRLAPSIGSTTRDEWQCYTENIDQYFKGPNPTGDLEEALLDYADVLNADCTITVPETGTVLPTCPFPGKEKWCAFPTAAPSSIIPAWSTFGSAVSSWWAAHSSGASSLARYCPNRWRQIMTETPYGELWLNDTIAWAECYADAQPTNAQSGSSTKTTTPGAATPTVSSNKIGGRMNSLDMVAVAGAGLLAAAA